MHKSKFMVLLGVCLVNLTLTIQAEDQFSDASISKEMQNKNTGMQLISDPSIDIPFRPPPVQITEEIVKLKDDVILEELPPLTRKQIPSGRLLEAGAIFQRNAILNNSSSNPNGLNRDDFNDSLDELLKANLDNLKSSREKERPNLYKISHAFSKPGVYPLSLALLEYETLSDTVLHNAKSFQDYYNSRTTSKLGKTNTFAASTVQAEVVYGQTVQFILPKELMFLDDDTKIEDVVFEFQGKKQVIKIGQPIEVNIKTKADIERIQKGNTERTDKNFTLYVTANGRQYTTRGQFMWADPMANLNSGVIESTLSCFDMPQITATQSYAAEFGKINIRIYPSQGTVTNAGANPTDCNNGINPALKQVLVIVDGFDPGGNRTQESIFEDFGPAITEFVNSGFDVVSVDYEDGRAYIQRNAYAVRELLVNQLPNWITADGDQRLVVVAGSMGTQTSRYAMRTAEVAGEDHNVDLWIAVDGPFKGANIPISIQAFVEFFSFSPSGQENLAGLNSPAASQQLLRNRYYDTNLPATVIFQSNAWYLPRPDFYSYYNEVNQLGLPQNSRNIALASGSGNGRLQGPLASSGASKSEFLRLNYSTFPEVFVRTLAQSDHAGEVFYGRYKVPGFLCNWPFNEADFCANWTARLKLNYPARLDLAPGGYRTSPTDIAELWNGPGGGRGTMYAPFETHNFIPTASALNIPLGSPYYQPHSDPNAFAASGFDRIWYESCNAQHVEQTSGMWAVVQQELFFFLQNSAPNTTEPPLHIPNCDDQVSTVNYWMESASAVDEGQDIEIIVRRSLPAETSETVRAIVVGGTATPNQDYTSNTTGLYSALIPLGGDTATIRIPTLVDDLNEGTESVAVKLLSSTYSDAGYPATFSEEIQTGYINNVDTSTADITASCYANLVGMINGPYGDFPHYQLIGNASSSNGTIVERRISINSSTFGPWIDSTGNEVVLANVYPGGPGQYSDYFIVAQFKDSLGLVAEASCSASSL